MEDNELQSIISSINTKLGTDNSALIADDLASLITKNSNVIKNIQSKDDEIKNLKSRNDTLVIANGNLLQQVPMGKEEKQEQKEENKPFNFRTLFDDKGNLKK